MVLATRPRQEDIKHYLPDSADVSVVRGDRSLRLRTICATREEAERTFLLFTFSYGLGAGRPERVGQAPGAAWWVAPVTAVGREARVCMSCDRSLPFFDCCVTPTTFAWHACWTGVVPLRRQSRWPCRGSPMPRRHVCPHRLPWTMPASRPA